MSTGQCPQCGLLSSLGVEFCARCGAELNSLSIPEQRLAPTDNQSSYVIPQARAVDVLGAALALFLKNFWFITKLVFVIFAPFEIFKALTFDSQQPDWQSFLGAGFLGLVCKALIAPSIIYSMYVFIQTGTTPSLNEAYRWGLSRLGNLALCAGMAWTLQTLGLILLIIPGIILTLAFELVFPMASLENRSPVEILKRSFELTKGYRWSILGAGILLSLLSGVLSVPINLVSAALLANNAKFWPLEATLALVMDIVNVSTTLLSLVFYLSILATGPRKER